MMIKNLEQVVSMVLNSFRDPHSCVRWAAISAVCQLSTDLGPDLQVQYHQRVLPALAGAMDDYQNPRVQANAASVVLNFSANCTPYILLPYLDGIVSKLLVLLQIIPAWLRCLPIKSESTISFVLWLKGLMENFWGPTINIFP